MCVVQKTTAPVPEKVRTAFKLHCAPKFRTNHQSLFVMYKALKGLALARLADLWKQYNLS